jgi:two-component system cell cycle response regulator
MEDLSGETLLSNMVPAPDEVPAVGPPLPAYLVVLAGGIPGAMLRLLPGCTRVGRAPDNAFPLPEPSVSRHHAVLRTGDDGRVWLVDLGSTNGTYLNGRRVPDLEPQALHDGDRLQFGMATVVKFSRPDPYEEQFQHAMFERTVRDGLTGLYNRSYFLDQVDLLADLAARRGLGLAVLLIDVDHFKRVNDTLGHAAGDAVLREVAGAIRHSTRAEDLVARFGGEEFVVALPVAAAEQAAARAERIRHDLAGRRIAAAGRALQVTASIGLAFAPVDRPRPATALLAEADLGLYQAKGAGRNRVAFRPAPADPEPATRDEDAGLPMVPSPPRIPLTMCGEK